MHHYYPMEKLAGGLYAVRGELGKSPLGRRMTVVNLPGGGLALHSVIRMSEDDMQRLDAMGKVSHILVPNDFHTTDAGFYAQRYPQAAVLAPRDRVKKLSGRFRVTGSFEDDWTGPLAGALEALVPGGLRSGEGVFFHPASKTLILTDLVFNLGNEFTGLTRLFLALNQSLNRFGPSRIFRWFMLKDPRELAASLAAVLAWDFDRVIVSHGAVVETGGREALQKAFAWLPGSTGV
ncbi:MAG: DUF4336 domain-containing protein [Deltaproteobacteria bacterium]|nr:DUF4336 domain-containing protein [Deltaproteobacteria bacterium]